MPIENTHQAVLDNDAFLNLKVPTIRCLPIAIASAPVPVLSDAFVPVILLPNAPFAVTVLSNRFVGVTTVSVGRRKRARTEVTRPMNE